MNAESLDTIDLDTLAAVTGGGKLWRKIKHKVEKGVTKLVDDIRNDFPTLPPPPIEE